MTAVEWSAPFEALCLGQRLATRGRTVTEGDVVGFAALTGDWHPQHADATWAASSRFGERIAHGMLIVSYAVGLMAFDPERVVALRRVTDVVFKRPVRLGDTIHAEGRIAGLTALDEETGLVGCVLSVLNQDDGLVCRVRVDVLWRRGDVSSSRRGELGSPDPSESHCADAGAGRGHEQSLTYSPGVFPC